MPFTILAQIKSLSSKECTKSTCTVRGERCVPFKLTSTATGKVHTECIFGISDTVFKQYHGQWCATSVDKWGKYYDWDWCPFCEIGGLDCCNNGFLLPNEPGNCRDKQGSCTNDIECAYGMYCGTNNCLGFGHIGSDFQNCCYDPTCDKDKGHCDKNTRGDCVRTTGQHGCCKFPFRYNGVEYRDCTTAGSYYPWCATQLYGIKYTNRSGGLLLPGFSDGENEMYAWDYCRI